MFAVTHRILWFISSTAALPPAVRHHVIPKSTIHRKHPTTHAPSMPSITRTNTFEHDPYWEHISKVLMSSTINYPSLKHLNENGLLELARTSLSTDSWAEGAVGVRFITQDGIEKGRLRDLGDCLPFCPDSGCYLFPNKLVIPNRNMADRIKREYRYAVVPKMSDFSCPEKTEGSPPDLKVLNDDVLINDRAMMKLQPAYTVGIRKCGDDKTFLFQPSPTVSQAMFSILKHVMVYDAFDAIVRKATHVKMEHKQILQHPATAHIAFVLANAYPDEVAGIISEKYGGWKGFGEGGSMDVIQALRRCGKTTATNGLTKCCDKNILRIFFNETVKSVNSGWKELEKAKSQFSSTITQNLEMDKQKIREFRKLRQQFSCVGVCNRTR